MYHPSDPQRDAANPKGVVYHRHGVYTNDRTILFYTYLSITPFTFAIKATRSLPRTLCSCPGNT